jgi:D-alanyl-D-alanine carboxypeptidase
MLDYNGSGLQALLEQQSRYCETPAMWRKWRMMNSTGRITVVLFSCLALTLMLASSCGQPPAVKDVGRLERSIGQTMKTMTCPGVIFAVTAPGKSDVIIVKGLNDLQKRTAISTADNFRIGSVTKTFTSIVMLQLASEGKVSLDDPVSKYEPQVPNGSSITVRMLLNHTSGLYSYTDDPGFQKAIETEPLRPWTPDEVINIGLSHPPMFAPGTSFAYDNTAYVLAGKVIEKVTGNQYTSEIKKRVIDKLGLKNTTLPAGFKMPGRYSHGYTYDLGGGLKDITQQQVTTWGWSAGGLVSDLADMQVFAWAVATGQLLTPAMKKEFFSWSAMPTKPGTPPSAFSGLGVGKVYGWVGNTGGTYGYTTWMWYVPARKTTVIAFFNETSTFTPKYEKIEQIALQKLLMTAISVI